jgi:hypothetical protein
MPVLHIGDTGDMTKTVDATETLEPRRRRWSRFRAVSFGVCLAITALFALTLFGNQGHSIASMSDGLLLALGVTCALSINVALLAWAYDVVAPKVFGQFAAIREGQREVLAELDDVRKQLAELAESITVYGGDKRQDGYEAALRDTGYRMPAHNTRRGDRPFLLLNNDRQGQHRQSM